MIITTEKEVQFNHEKIKVGVIEGSKITTADFVSGLVAVGFIQIKG